MVLMYRRLPFLLFLMFVPTNKCASIIQNTDLWFRSIFNSCVGTKIVSASTTFPQYLHNLSKTSSNHYGKQPHLLCASSMLDVVPLGKLALVSGLSVAVTKIFSNNFWGSYHKLSPYEKLGTTPLFYLCNSRGSSFLQQDLQAGKPEQKIITYFMSYADVDEYLQEMAQVNSQSANDFRIMTVSLEKVLNSIQRRKQSRKVGRMPLDIIHRLQPSLRQCIHAAKLLGGRSGSADKGITIPMFSVDGLAIQRQGFPQETIVPYYFSYEDLLEDWCKYTTGVGALPSSSSLQLSHRKTVVIPQSAPAKPSAGSGSASFPSFGSNLFSRLTYRLRLFAGASSNPVLPQVSVSDFTDVMTRGVWGKHFENYLLKQQSSEVQAKYMAMPSFDDAVRLNNNTKSNEKLTVGIVPSRNEIDIIKRFYRNGEGPHYSKSVLMNSPTDS